MDSVGEGEGGEIWENDIETCIISCMKPGAQGWGNGKTRRDGMGREVGGGTQDGEHMYTHG